MKQILIIAVILFTGCSSPSQLAKEKNRECGSIVEVVSRNAGKHSIAYQGYHGAYNEAVKECDISFCDSTIRVIKLEAVPKGGYVHVYFSGYTLQDSKPGNYEYVVQNALGEVIRRESGDKYSIPNHSQNGGWYDFDVFDIRLPVDYPFKVFIINKLDNTRSEFIVKSGN